MKAGFIGVGEMGGPMAVNLSSNYQVTAYCHSDLDQSAVEGSAVNTTQVIEDLAETDVIFLCVPNGQVVEQVLFAQNGLAEQLAPGTIVVDTSTIDYHATLIIAEKLASVNLKFMDAPISGMRARAEDASLTMMCGGESTLYEELQPLLSTMASKILHMGPVGSGQLTKLINQLLFDINAAALAEILPLSVKLGLDAEKMGAVVNSGTGRSYASEFFIPHILNNDFSHGYPMQHAYKDLVSGSQLSMAHQIPTPVLSAAIATYQGALAAGHGGKDKGGMIRVFEEMLGVSYRSEKPTSEK